MDVKSRAITGLKDPTKRLTAAPRLRKLLYLHHTVTPTSLDWALDWRKVQRVAFDRGYADISYTFGVHWSGVAMEGRAPNVLGAHTEGYNSTAHAIVLIGNYEVSEPTVEMINAVRELRAHMVATGLLTDDHVFRYHRMTSSTACPGAKVRNRWSDFTRLWVPPAPPSNTDLEDFMLPPTFGQGTDNHHATGIIQSALIWHARDIVAMQMRGFENVEGFVDGNFGPGTAGVLAAWQKRTGALRTDGVCDPATYRWLVGV